MKIAVFYNLSFSGAKRVVKEHVVGLKSYGNVVDVYTTDNLMDIFHPKPFANNTYIYKFNPTPINFPILRRIKSDFFNTFIQLRLLHKKIAHDIDQGKYDVVLVHTDINTQAPFLLRYLKTKNIYYCLEPLRNAYEYSLRLKDASFLNKAYENVNRWIRKEIDRTNALAADEILTLSLFARERIIAAYDLYPKVSYIGVDTTIFKPIDVKKKNQILFIADETSIYGYDLIEKALQYIPKKIKPNLKVISWKKKNNDRLSDNELVKVYNESLFTLSLSKFDTFGLVTIESMSCGVPVIALNVAGYREIITDGTTGYLVDFDPKEISEKIIYLIKNSEKLLKLGTDARKEVLDKWTWKMHVKKLNILLNQIVKDANSKNS